MELSEIALQKLLQLFPELSAYIVSFKDITEEAGKEESGLQIGIFILQFGMDYYYIPVIAKNDTVLPIDSLFNASEGTFVPLSRTFLDKVISASQIYLGQRANIPKTVPKNPSIHELVVPPRTGKYTYASSSRLVEFLAQMPSMVKQAVFNKMSSDKEVYSAMHRMFGLENILAALKHEQPEGPKISAVQKSAVELITEGHGLDNSTIREILDKGYALRGEHTTDRVAVLANEFEKLGPLKQLSGADAGEDYEVVMKSGEVHSAYVPKRSRGANKVPALLSNRNYATGSIGIGNSSIRSNQFLMFANGDYAITDNFVVRGEGSAVKNVARQFFGYKDALTPRNVPNHTRVAIFAPNLDLIGAYNIHSSTETSLGVTIKGYSLLPGEHNVVINAYRNCQVADLTDAGNIFIPINTLIAPLGEEVSDELEINVNAALARFELGTLTALGSAINMGFDGIEFTIEGKPVGPEIKVIEILVGREGIAPEKAENFVKQAKERRHVKIYLSKKADFEPAEHPQFGDIPPDQPDNFGPNNQEQFDKNLKASLGTEDSQTVESMVISELLQATDMNSLVKEYLPDISAALDKIGRTLFLARLNMDKLSESQNSNELMSFIANLRNVYRLLGDNAVKLERMVSGPELAQEEAGEVK